MRSPQKRSATSRSEVAWLNWTDAATPSSAKRGTSSGASSCACSIRGRRPSGRQSSRVASNASSASRLARSPIAWTASGNPARGACADQLVELLAARDLDPGAVEHPRGLRAERAVHERLQVAEPQQRAAEAAADVRASRARPPSRPEATARRAGTARPRPRSRCQKPERADPAVLVVHRGDAAGGGELEPGAHRLDVLVVGDLDRRRRGSASTTPRAGRRSARRARRARRRRPAPAGRRSRARARPS